MMGLVVSTILKYGIYFGAVALINVIRNKIKLWGQQRKMPQTQQAQMSETDLKEIEVTKELINTCFEGDPVSCLKNASNVEKINMMSGFAQKLAEEYGLDVEIDVTIDESKSWGYYNWEENKAVFNIAQIVLASNSENFAYFVRESLDTIVHELRHAVQYKAIRESGFWGVDDERRKLWADNIQNYIQPTVDFKAYSKQPIENDAITFAALALEGVAA